MKEMLRQSVTLESLPGFATRFLELFPQGAAIGLVGDLGAGKTTFVRECIRQLACRGGVAVDRVTSPSFVIHQSYPDLTPPVDHFDLYRLSQVDEAALIELGYPDTLSQNRKRNGFVFVEWPENAKANSLALTAQISVSIDEKTGARSFVLMSL